MLVKGATELLQDTTNGSLVRVRYGLSFMSLNPDLCSDTTVLYENHVVLNCVIAAPDY